MFRFTIRKALGLAAIFAAVLLVFAASANAAYSLSRTPTMNNFATTFCANSGQMFPQFWVDGANLDLYRVETQKIFVQLGLYSQATGFVADSTVYYGVATGMDISTRESMDHVQTWYDYFTGRAYSQFGLGIYNRGHGTYQVAMRFAWDVSSSGAPSSFAFYTNGWTNWIWAPGTCTY